MKELFKYFTLLTFLLIYNTSSCQKGKIIFKYHHTMRIPFSDVHIEISNNKTSYHLKVDSKAANNDVMWKYSNIQFDSLINQNVFEKLYTKLVKFEAENIPKDETVYGDGYSCSIEFISDKKKRSFNYNCPDDETEERKLVLFLELCHDIISAAGLKPEEIFMQKGG